MGGNLIMTEQFRIIIQDTYSLVKVDLDGNVLETLIQADLSPLKQTKGESNAEFRQRVRDDDDTDRGFIRGRLALEMQKYPRIEWHLNDNGFTVLGV
jgi:hypothetical protein